MKRHKYLSMFLVTILLLTIFIPINPFLVNTASATWWNTDWDYYRTITIESDYIDSELTDFPILVSISDVIGDKCKANGEDIRFLLPNNSTVLNHEIEKWVDGSDRIIWVKIPTVTSGVDTVILMYYGNSEASDSQNPSGVWDSDFGAVYHFKESAGNFMDSTSNNNDGTFHGTMPNQATAKIGDGQDFNDADADYITVPDSDAWDTNHDFTINFWIKFVDYAKFNYLIMHKEDTNNRWYLYQDTTRMRFCLRYGGSNQIDMRIEPEPIQDNNWHRVTVTREGNDWDIYVDGVVGASETGIKNDIFTDILLIGVDYTLNPAYHFDGYMDELRFSNVFRSEVWRNVSFHSQNQSTGFLTWGNEQEVPHPPTITSWNADTESGATSGWDWNNNDLQVDWVVADIDSDTLTLLWTFSKGGTPSDPTTVSYNGRKTGIESGSYTMSNQDLNWDNGDWSNYRGTVNFKFRLHDGTDYSTTIETDTLTGGIDGTDPDTTIMEQSDTTEGIDSIWGTATDTVCYVDHVDMYIKNTTDGTWWIGDSWSTETWLSASANDTSFDSSNENWNYDSSGVTWGRKSYEMGAKTTDESGRNDLTPAIDTFIIKNPPIQSDEIPTNSSTGIALLPYLYIHCTDADNDNLNATWWSNSSGTWIQFASNWTGFANGTTIRQTNENFSIYGETYYWSLNLTDGIDWCNETYHFTIRVGWDFTQPLAWLIRNATGVTILKLSMSGNLAIAGTLFEQDYKETIRHIQHIESFLEDNYGYTPLGWE